jgi:hypothetical protein
LFCHCNKSLRETILKRERFILTQSFQEVSDIVTLLFCFCVCGEAELYGGRELWSRAAHPIEGSRERQEGTRYKIPFRGTLPVVYLFHLGFPPLPKIGLSAGDQVFHT